MLWRLERFVDQTDQMPHILTGIWGLHVYISSPHILTQLPYNIQVQSFWRARQGQVMQATVRHGYDANYIGSSATGGDTLSLGRALVEEGQLAEPPPPMI